MTKRAFIDAVRQYAQQSKRLQVSFGDQVMHLYALYLQACREAGYGEPELEKEASWSRSFLMREYGQADRGFEFSE